VECIKIDLTDSSGCYRLLEETTSKAAEVLWRSRSICISSMPSPIGRYSQQSLVVNPVRTKLNR
jgi:hypothetical protein